MNEKQRSILLDSSSRFPPPPGPQSHSFTHSIESPHCVLLNLQIISHISNFFLQEWSCRTERRGSEPTRQSSSRLCLGSGYWRLWGLWKRSRSLVWWSPPRITRYLTMVSKSPIPVGGCWLRLGSPLPMLSPTSLILSTSSRSPSFPLCDCFDLS